MSTTRETAAEKKAREAKEAEDAKAANAKDGATDNGADDEVETVEVSDPNNNARREEVPADAGIAEPERSFPFQPTAEDANGIQRVLPASDPNWEPAPLEATEADKARAAEREKKAEEYATARKEGRIDQITGRVLSKEEKRDADKEAKA